MAKRYWLMKSEPGTFSIDDLERAKTTAWDGVRNYQARNFMRDQMQKGDGVLFYHSSCPVPGIAGFARVCSDAYPDPTQFDQRSKYYDDKSKPSTPRWFLVDIQFVKKLKDVIPLEVIKSNPALADMKLVQRGQRLSVQPVTPAEWKAIVAMTG